MKVRIIVNEEERKMAKKGSHLMKKNISFKSVKDMTLGEVFGTKPIGAGEIMGAVWKVIKAHDLRDA